MVKRKYSKRNTEPTFTLTELEQYGFGDWLKKNMGSIGTVVGTGLGALVGVPQLGAMAGGAVGGAIQQNTAQDEQNKAIQEQNEQNKLLAQNKSVDINPTINTPVFCHGGRMRKYPNGGTLDSMTNVRQTIQTNPNPLAPVYLTDRGDSMKGALQAETYRRANEATWKGSKDYWGNLSNTIKNFPKSDLRGQEEYDAYVNANPQFAEAATKYNFAPQQSRGFGLKMPIVSNDSIITATKYPERYKQLSTPIKSNGGYVMEYGGASHTGGGIPVDGATGNPTSIYGGKPDAEVEGKEVAVKFPKEETPFIFSDKLGFASKAKKIQNKYSKRPNDDISQKAMYMELGGLMQDQEAFKAKKMEYHQKKLMEYGGELKAGTGYSFIDDNEYTFGGPVLGNNLVGGNEDYQYEDGGDLEGIEFGKGGWIKKAAASIKRRGTEGKCTPITKPGCTGRARALALTFKKIARNRKKEDGGELEEFEVGNYLNNSDDYIRPEMGVMADLPEGYGDVLKPMALENTSEQYRPYRGSAIPMLASAAGNLALMATTKRPDTYKAAQISPEQISLEAARTGIKENTAISRANKLKALREAGLTPAQYSALVATSDLDLNRGANEGLRESYMQEQVANAGARTRANEFNAQQQAEAQKMNMSLRDQYRRQQGQYMQNIAEAVPAYFGQREKYDTLSATNENYQIVKDKYGRVKYIPKTKLG